jgi:hypothetical protein
MKYTNLIINGNIIDIESLIPQNKIQKTITLPIIITIAMCGVFVLIGFLPITIAIDETRHIKSQFIKMKRKYDKSL